MRVQTYDSVTGQIVSEQALELDFGDVIQGRHCSHPVVLRVFPNVETTITDMTSFLDSKGGWESAELGYYLNSSFVEDVQSGGDLMDNHFVETQDATAGSPNGVPLQTADSTSEYMWLDIDLSNSQTGATAVTYRFIYNYT